jgi:hypothetical protein
VVGVVVLVVGVGVVVVEEVPVGEAEPFCSA